MFYYYGRKKQIARHYPSPNFGTIIEPFAGAASYALFGNNWKKNVILIEKDSKVASIWEWFIHEASKDDITNLPNLSVGEKSSEFLHIIHAATKMAFHFKTIKVTPILERNWEISKRYIAENLYKIKHWEIICADYSESPDIEGTWFIDPPYKGDAGLGYRHSSKLIDYEYLANWAKNRKGEVIFCEGHNGDYLPFRHLLESKGVAGKTSKEMIYFQSNQRILEQQLDLFFQTAEM